MNKGKYTPIIGMEVHVELSTKRKMFCGCDASHFGVEPNTHVCPVCLGLPGALPVPNEKAIEDIIKIGHAFECKINIESKFDRKHYFYPDLPKGFQISQYDEPFCEHGKITLLNGKEIRITRIHLEEDTGKLQHAKDSGKSGSLIDFNRSGVPLVEIVSEPDINSAEEAKEYLKIIHSTVRFLGVSDADMEKGSMRLEANISLSRDGTLPDYKVEIKNVNSFRYIAAAIDYEIERQSAILDKGEIPVQETRGWSQGIKKTFSQRIKEEAKDYRYFPEPDIPVIHLDSTKVENFKKEMGILPTLVRDKLINQGVKQSYVMYVIEDKELSNYVLGLLDSKVEELDKMIGLLVNRKVDYTKVSKEDFIKDFEKDNEKEVIDEELLEKWVNQALNENQSAVEDYRNGKTNTIQFLVGVVMKFAQGKTDPNSAREMLVKKLAN